MSVSASKVEALCDLKQALLDHGIPESLIGIKHSYADEATFPSTGNDDRRYQLVTHARVRGGSDNQLFVEHEGRPRALMIYDESLFRSDAQRVSERTLRMELAALREYVRGLPKETEFCGLIAYLERATSVVTEQIGNQKTCPNRPLLLILPELGDVERDGYLALLGTDQRWVTLRNLLGLVGYTLRTILTAQDEGLVSYQIAVPAELGNILILDASYPIRELVRLDQTITDATPEYVRKVKLFNNVTVNQMRIGSGRESMTRNFSQAYPEDRTVSREVTKLVASVPEEKSILIFTFKARNKEVDIPGIIRRDLRNGGVDVGAKTDDGRDRINILTWGDETSLNRYSHCEVVILVGLLHLPCLDVASRIIGQQDSLGATASNTEVARMIDSEIAHSVYQAISRGCCRVVADGEAKGMDVYLFHRKSGLKETLASVMPGIKWHDWLPTYVNTETHSAVEIQALQVKEYLDRQPEDRTKVPTKEIRQWLNLEQCSDSIRKMLDRALDRVCSLGGWRRHGHSLIRYGALFGC